MSSLDKSGVPITMYKMSGDTELTGTTAVKVGGAYVTVPSGADILLGIFAHLSPVGLTADQAQNAWGYLDSPDGLNIKPFEFAFPNAGCADATSSYSNSTPGIYYPVNQPVSPGDRLECWATSWEANTDEPNVSVVYWFGRKTLAPKTYDDYPGRHRWRKIGHTAAASVAAGYAPENQYQFTLGAEGGQITELGALVWTTTAAAAQSGGAIVQFISDDVPGFPQDIFVNAYGSLLGAVGGHKGSFGVTRRPCSAFGEKLVHMDCAYLTNANMVATTGYMVSMVEFVRNGE